MELFLQHVLNGMTLGSIYALIALGYSIVYGILKMINFAHSDVYMVGAFACFYAARWLGLEAHPGLMSFLILLVIAMICCSVLGVAIERLAYRPLRSGPKLNILITAIGVSLFLEYSGQVVFGASPQVFPEVIKEKIYGEAGSFQLRSFDVTVILTTVIAMLVLHRLIKKTKTGIAMRAVSNNATVAGLMGINVDRIITFAFVLGSSLAGVGSLLVGLKYPKIDPLMGMMIGLKAFVAAVLGGIGHLPGAVLGGLVMGLSEEMVVAYISSTYRDALAFGLLIIILLFKPEGLMGKPSIEKV
jgi:branched-chain amino acid transport system permease protein